MEIYDLKTEGQTSPLGLDTIAPAFSWKLKGDGVMQNTYRIQVVSEKKWLYSGAPDMWDSGLIHSRESFEVYYHGLSLHDCTLYFWQVEVNGVLSEIASFETAFLDSARFKAEWIGMPLAFSGYTDVVRLEFVPDKHVKRARLYLAALGCAQVSLNGHLLDDSYFDGAVSVYSKRIFYRTFALDGIREGLNALAVELGYGFYGAKKIYGEVYLEYENGTNCCIPTMCGRVWMITHGSVTQNSIYGGEHCDARLYRDFSSPNFFANTVEYVSAYAVDSPLGELKSCTIPPMRVMEKSKPYSLTSNGKGKILVDAGRNLTGWLQVVVTGAVGDKVTIAYAEVLDESGKISTANLRRADCCDQYILAGEGEETYAPRFTYHGFRYAQITLEGGVKLLRAEAQHIRTAVKQVGEFACSDHTLNTLHLMASRTESNNLNGIFTDCPQRDERLGWLNDLTARAYQAVCNYDLSRFLPNFIDLITLSAREDGAIGDTVPFMVGSRFADPVSAFHVLCLLSLRFYGNKAVIERNYSGLCHWLEKLEERVVDGVLDYGIYGDWCPANPYAQKDGTHSMFVSVQFMSAAYLVWYFDMMREFAVVLENRADERNWTAKGKAYREAFYSRFYNENTGVFGNGSQTECAVAMTIFKDDKKLCAHLAKQAVRDICERGNHTTCGNQGYRHLFYRLAEYGYSSNLVQLLKNPEYPGWGFMVQQGATSVWERWENIPGSDMHSYNHPMFGSYDGFFYNYLAGIRTNQCEHAFEKIVVEPCFVPELQFVCAKLETLRGTISVDWYRSKEDIHVVISTPANTRLIFRAKGFCLTCGDIVASDELELSNGTFSIFLGMEI